MSHTNDSAITISKGSDFVLRFCERLCRYGGHFAVAALASIAGMMGYEVVARSFFNSPTSWSTEVSTYVLVAVAYLGLATVQLNQRHVAVDIIINRLPTRVKDGLGTVTDYLSFFFIIIATWQFLGFNISQYHYGARSWGMLALPQWIPQVPASFGIVLFCLSILLTTLYRRPVYSARRRWAGYVLIAAFVIAWIGISFYNPKLLLNRVFPGVFAIGIVVATLATIWHGFRFGVSVLLVLAVTGVMFAVLQSTSVMTVGVWLAIAAIFMLLIGVPISIALAIAGLFGLQFLPIRPQLSALPTQMWTSINTFTLTAVPMFIFMGTLLLKSNIIGGLFDALARWFGRVPAGLAHASATASGVFAAVSGSSLATAATVGKISCPELISRGYNKKMTFGVTAAGATLGVLIPPSIPMIIYGTAVGSSVTRLFMAGVIPGLLLLALIMLTTNLWAIFRPGDVPKAAPVAMSEKVRALPKVLPFLALIFFVLGSMYFGIATPTEAAAVGVWGALLMCILSTSTSWKDILDAAIEATIISSMILWIVVGASVFNWIIDFKHIPQAVVQLIGAEHFSPGLIIVIMTLIYILLGMFVESISMMLMTIPITYPLALSIGLDPIWFGVFLVLMIEIGLITPPLGMILFVLQGIDQRHSLEDIIHGVVPYIVTLLAFLMILYFFPQIVLWLPSQM